MRREPGAIWGIRAGAGTGMTRRKLYPNYVGPGGSVTAGA